MLNTKDGAMLGERTERAHDTREELMVTRTTVHDLEETIPHTAVYS